MSPTFVNVPRVEKFRISGYIESCYIRKNLCETFSLKSDKEQKLLDQKVNIGIQKLP